MIHGFSQTATSEFIVKASQGAIKILFEVSDQHLSNHISNAKKIVLFHYNTINKFMSFLTFIDRDWDFKTVNIIVAYLSAFDVNVIAVDWNQLARSPFYPMAATNVEFVGKITAQFVDFLVNQGYHNQQSHLSSQ